MNNWENIQDIEDVQKKDNKELLQFLYKILGNWYWFVIGGMLGLILASLYLKYQTPVYQIDAKLLINDDSKGGGGGKSDLLDLNNLIGVKSSVDDQAEVLKTRFLMEEVVKDLKANISYYHKGRVRDYEIYNSPFILNTLNVRDSIAPISFTVKPLGNNKLELSNDDFTRIIGFNEPFILENVGKVQLDKNPGIPMVNTIYKCVITSVDSKVAAFMGSLKVAVTNKQVSTIDLSFGYPIPRKGEDILNTLIRKYAEETLNDKNRIADSTIAFIENRLLYVGQELGGIEGNIQTFKQNSKIADITEQSKLLIESSGEYLNELVKTETQLSIVNSLESYLKDESKNKRVLPSAVLESDQVVGSLIERYNTLLMERDRQSLSSTDSNPYIQNLDQQIANLRKDMLSNLINTRNTLIITRNKLLQRTGQVEGQIRQVPAKERTYLDLARQQQIKQELYIFLLQKKEETAISKTSNISNSKVIDPPKSQAGPISPNRMKTLMIGLILGLGFPFAIIYLKGLLNNKVLSKEDISTKVPVIAEISNSTTEGTIVVSHDSRSPIAEQFRALRTNLSFFLNDNEKTVLLTSSMSGEGKSFVALNLATVLAISGKKVVVMEMDLRKPNLSNKLNINNTFGFTNYIISKEIPSDEIIIPSGIHENLFIISSGPIPPNPAEVILNEKTAILMAQLNEKFDYIIIDAPPIGLVTDAQLLSKYADLTLYLVRQGYTYKNQLNIPDDIFKNKKMKKIALLVNDIKQGRGHYGYGYGYGYGSGYYVDDKDDRSSFWRKLSRKAK